MPAVDEKAPVLGGRGHVCRFSSGSSAGQYVYREWNKSTRSYRTKSIPDATNLQEAIEMAASAAIALRDSINQVKQHIEKIDPLDLYAREQELEREQAKLYRKENKEKDKAISIDNAIDYFLEKQERRVAAGTFRESSYKHKKQCMEHVRDYLKYRGVVKTSQFNTTTFDEYLEFRCITTRLVQARELSVLGEWIKSYLVRYNYIPTSLWLSGTFLPKVKVRMVDRMANPAIDPDDWKVIVDYVREVWRPQAWEPQPYFQKGDFKGVRSYEKRTVWFRTLFWHYILFSKNTGMSPEEVLKLKWKNVEIRDVGRISRSKLEEDLQAAVEEGYGDLDGTSEDWLGDVGEWAESPQQLGREERLVAYITTIRSKTQQAREVPCNQGRELKRWIGYQKKYMEEWGIKHMITPDDYVFMNPFNEFKPAHHNRIGPTWRKIVRKLKEEGKIKGHKFSEKPYTLYSMRSTFIEDHLRKGTDVFLVARIAGHDVKTLMQTYERLDIKERAEEITNINYGQVTKDITKVDLLDT